MSKDPIVGIDLGTSNSCVAMVGGAGHPVVLADEQGRKIIPSVVSFHPNGSVLTGVEAKQRRVIDPRNTVFSVKRILGRPFSAKEVVASASRSSFGIKEGQNQQPLVVTRAGEFGVPEISAIVLDKMRAIATGALKTEVRRAVVTVPANFNDAQRQATALAGEIAELVVVRILNEPTAAALAYGHGKALRQIVAVYDFGGGTFDVTILALRDNVYEVLATAGDTFLGGDDIDNRLVDYMVHAFLQANRIDLRTDELAIQRLRAVAEQVKCELSSRPKAVVTVEEIAVGAGGAALNLGFTLQRDAFVERVADIVDRSFPVCDEALRLAGLAPTQIDEVVLVGGTTKMPYVRDRVAAYFGRTPRMDVNPDEAVALGAALQGAALAQVLDRPAAPRRTMPGVAAATPPPRAPAGFSPTPLPEPGILDLEDESSEEVTVVPALPPASPGARTEGSALGRLPMKKVAVRRAQTPAPITEVNEFAGSTAVETQERTFVNEEAPRPVLLDVTPRGLAVGTVGGFCDEIITRNAQIPIEQTRVFSTAHDDQTSVEIRVCQGESRRFAENTLLGTLVLDGLEPRPRGKVKIAVTFEINTDGMLDVSARDEATGHARSARIELLAMQSEEEVQAARERLRDLRGAR